jgi:undecaprenyl diphosphate synthase
VSDSIIDVSPIPAHVAIIMDGNGRWASARHLPRFAGHKAGVNAVTASVRLCAQAGVKVLTLFAFSSENWGRPEEEVSLLMGLFINALRHEIKEIHAENVRLEIIGETTAFNAELRRHIEAAEALTAQNTGLELRIAANYGGRWDIVQAAKCLAREVEAGNLAPSDVSEETFARHLSLAGLPEPDLFIRTGGERRISNFLLWNLAYTELYFSDVLWPDFGGAEFESALAWFANRQRRFGRTGEQVKSGESSVSRLAAP